MSIVLTKNTTINLQKSGIPLGNGLVLALSWSSKGSNPALDLDASVFGLADSGKLVSDSTFVFYNNMEIPGIKLTGDSRDGAKDGIDESILINLNGVDTAIKSLVVCVSIHNPTATQNFSLVDAKIAIIDATTKSEVAAYDLDDKSPTATAVIMGVLRRVSNTEWEFQAKGENVDGGLEALVARYQ